MYVERFYRHWVGRDDLCRFEIVIGESDLLILCDHEAAEPARLALARARNRLTDYLAGHPEFVTSLVPVAVDDDAPEIVQTMAAAAERFEVGPMAAVAGAIAERVGRDLIGSATTVIVENGGDVFAIAPTPIRFALYAGAGSPFSGLGFEITPTGGVGVCASSGKVGPSLSFGSADAVVAIAADTAAADAAATAFANRVHGPDDIDRVLREAATRPGLLGLIACAGDRLGVWGQLELVPRAQPCPPPPGARGEVRCAVERRAS